jgi:hypothetical protein
MVNLFQVADAVVNTNCQADHLYKLQSPEDRGQRHDYADN